MTPSSVVSVIVVNYNGKNDLTDCIDSLLSDSSKTDREIIIVDNNSTDGSSDILSNYSDKKLKVIYRPINMGYAGAVNLGLSESSGKYIAVLNMDLIMQPGWLDPLVAFLDANAQVGAVNPLILLHKKEHLINAIGQHIHVSGLGFNRGLNCPVKGIKSNPVTLSGIHGSAFLIRRSIFQEMGGWDQSGFLYHEDVQLSWMLHLLGYGMYCIPQSRVRHKYHLTMNPDKLFLLERNRLFLLLTHMKIITLFVVLPILLLSEFLALGFSILRGPNFLRAKCRGYRDLWRKVRLMRITRRRIFAIRSKSDWYVLRRLRWNYCWDQFFFLGSEGFRAKSSQRQTIPI